LIRAFVAASSGAKRGAKPVPLQAGVSRQMPAKLKIGTEGTESHCAIFFPASP